MGLSLEKCYKMLQDYPLEAEMWGREKRKFYPVALNIQECSVNIPTLVGCTYAGGWWRPVECQKENSMV
jgi:hypothetical protein